MSRRTPPGAILRRLVLLAMLLPFAALSAVPAGVMAARTDAGILTLVLCTSDGPQEVSVRLDPASDAPADRHGCPWAIAHVVVDLAEGPGLATPVATVVATVARAAGMHLLPARLPGPGTARAPPLPA